ncbi:FAD/NAD(P)-binding protein [Streptomyces malaysiensis]
MTTQRLDVCLIGAGPRGLSVLERLCANAAEAAPTTSVTIHVVDPYPPGAGRVWRSGQSRHLLMNTVAGQVTMFTDETVEMAGPVLPGPSLYEWARFVSLTGGLDEVGYDEEVLAEARRLTPDSYPTRAFHGHYLEWVHRRVTGTAPASVRTVSHRSRAVGLEERTAGGAQTVVLEDGTRLEGLHAVVLAQGHVPQRRSPREAAHAAFAEARGLRYVPPAGPAEVDLSGVRPGEAVGLLGLGLNFFDYLALLTEGRGGRFERRAGRLVYRPSGREPRLLAGSRRGVPFHSRGENQKGPHGRHHPLVLTPEVISGLRRRARERGGLDFRSELWPLISKEVETVYYTALLTSRGREAAAHRLRAAYPSAPRGGAEEDRLLTESGIPPRQRWNWDRIARPCPAHGLRSPAAFRSWLLEYLRADLEAARAGNVHGPLKAALDVLRDLRNEIRLVVDHGGLTARSHREDLDAWYTPLNAFVSIGPPARRIEEAVALIEAGVLTVLGPRTVARADAEEGAFVLESRAVPGSRRPVTTLIDARLPGTDVRSSADPLLSGLLADGQCVPYVVGGARDGRGGHETGAPETDGHETGAHETGGHETSGHETGGRETSGHETSGHETGGHETSGHEAGGRGTGGHETGGLAVGPSPYHLLNAAGRPHPRRFAFGVPTESVHWATAAGVRPGVGSVILSDADAISRAVLALRDGSPTDPNGPTGPTGPTGPETIEVSVP